MKKVMMILISLISMSSFAIDGSLDGTSYCRPRQTGGLFGQPPGLRNQCISFHGGRVKDNTNTFIGKPIESYSYDIVNQIIINVDLSLVTYYYVKGNSIRNAKTGDTFNKVR